MHKNGDTAYEHRYKSSLYGLCVPLQHGELVWQCYNSPDKTSPCPSLIISYKERKIELEQVGKKGETMRALFHGNDILIVRPTNKSFIAGYMECGSELRKEKASK